MKFLYYVPIIAYLLFMMHLPLPPIVFPVLMAVFSLSIAVFKLNTIKRVSIVFFEVKNILIVN
ncbi:hypothetical protein [Vibrio marisflavi]|uniref:Uncharacterized protein n=1 Tax=Vibrio marisflavi CECT 7928 TaxID=634439 RepID=A0ABM9A9H8_9VIBR|nr:hypothetical protein [Vibrio marisflavi]CAH0543179.1 hypothetical protein VMF7928_04444 [Vibrio marisflavi CECT 7928]